MKKNLLLIGLLFISAFSYSIDYDQIKDVGKIRWVDCGEDLLDYSENEELKINFDIPLAKKLYKFNESYKQSDKYGDVEIRAMFGILEEYKTGFFFVNMLASKYTQNKDKITIEKPESKNRIKYFDGFGIDYRRKDLKEIDYTSLEGIYLNNTGKYGFNDIELMISSVDFIPTCTIFLSDQNKGVIQEYGYHFIKWNQENNCFESIPTFGKIYRDNQLIANDDFKIKVIHFDEQKKLLLLETDKYTRPYVPAEDFFTPKTDVVYFRNGSYVGTPFDIHVYKEPNFDSEILYTTKCNRNVPAKVIESEREMHEINGEISKWVKVRLKSENITGWVWGRNISLSDYTSGLDKEKVLRYVEYNKVKK